MIRTDRGLGHGRRPGWRSTTRGGACVLVALLVLLVPGLVGPSPALAQDEPPPPSDDPTEPVSPLTPPDGAPVDPGHPLVDPVDPELVDAVTEANLRLSELDQEILETLGEIGQADQAIADLEVESAETRERIERTEARVAATEADIEQTEAEIAATEALLRERILDAYVAGSRNGDSFVETTSGPDVNARLIRQVISEALAATDSELAAQLEDRTDELEDHSDDLDRQRDRLGRREADLAALNQSVTQTRAERTALLDTLGDQRDEMAEVAAQAQEALDEALTFIAEQLAALAAIGIDGTSGLPPAGFALDGLPLCEAAGIVVACSISAEVAFMIAAARADGVTLTGYGWRSTAEQIALRVAHCGGDVFGASAGSCSPPTARPGSSQHEVGLAIDFESCSSRDTPCFQWLAQHAETYGFFNLPSEPWHWSTTGR